MHTSDITGADTEASIFITLLGERGDTGKRRLFVTQTEGKMFSQGKVSEFWGPSWSLKHKHTQWFCELVSNARIIWFQICCLKNIYFV